MSSRDDNLALVTVTFRRDMALFERLCASIDRHAPDFTHHVVIDRIDRPCFARFESERRRVIDLETLFPRFVATSLFGRRLLLSLKTMPLRGWIVQQLAKLAYVAQLPDRAAMVIDSDAEFLARLRMEEVIRDGRVRLYHAPGAGDLSGHRRWHRVAARALGLAETDYFGADYISTGVTWSPAVVRALLDRLERVGGRSWMSVLGRHLYSSEYILYGVFCEHVPGPHQALIFTEDFDLCHCSWHYNLAAETGRAAFIGDLKPDHRLALIQSNLGLGVEERDRLMTALRGRYQFTPS